jgi:hypothetical protein
MKSILLMVILPAGMVLAEASIAEPYPKERYTDTLSRSPFVLETPPGKPPTPQPSPLDNIVITGMGKLDDERNYVIAQRVGDVRSMKFIDNEPNEEGISVKEVKWENRWSDCNVVMKHGSEEKIVKFTKNSAPLVPPSPPNKIGRTPPRVGVQIPTR